MKRAKQNFALREGFWKSSDEPALPMPIANEKKWKGRSVFLASLAAVQAHNGGMQDEYIQVSHYRGWSNCRICNCKNGSGEFKLRLMGMTWKWPSGFEHYVRAHNVRPSIAFEEFINMAAKFLESEDA